MSDSRGTTVLFVDDEPDLLRSMCTGLMAEDKTLKVLTAESAEAALKIALETPLDLVVTDLNMPGKDGFWLLLELDRQLPTLPRMVMSSALTPASVYRAERAGVQDCLAKPVRARDLYQKIKQRVKQPEPLGFFRGISLASILQLLEMEQKTCSVRVQHGSESGQLFMVEGAVRDARLGAWRGEDAAVRILAWQETHISIDERCDRSMPDVIRQSVTSLVMGAAQRSDEEPEPAPNLDIAFFSAAPAAKPVEPTPVPSPVPPVPTPSSPSSPSSPQTPETSSGTLDARVSSHLSAEDQEALAKLIPTLRWLSAIELFETGYKEMKRGRVELAREILVLAQAKEPDNKLINHNLKVLEKKLAAAKGGAL